MENEDVIADFYRHLTGWEIPELDNYQCICKLNFQILYNPINTRVTWVEDMLLFALQMIYLDFNERGGFAIFNQRHHPKHMEPGSKALFYHVLGILVIHYNSLVLSHRLINEKMFFDLLDRQQIVLKTPPAKY